MQEKEIPQAVYAFAKEKINQEFHHINFVRLLNQTKVYSIVWSEDDVDTGFPTLILLFGKTMKLIEGPESLRYL